MLRRWDLNRILSRAQIDQAIEALMGWPLRVTQVRGLFADAWRYEPTSPSPTPYTWRSPRTLAPTSYLMMADWPRPLAFQSYCTCQVDTDPSRPSRQTPRIAQYVFGAVAC